MHYTLDVPQCTPHCSSAFTTLHHTFSDHSLIPSVGLWWGYTVLLYISYTGIVWHDMAEVMSCSYVCAPFPHQQWQFTPGLNKHYTHTCLSALYVNFCLILFMFCYLISISFDMDYSMVECKCLYGWGERGGMLANYRLSCMWTQIHPSQKHLCRCRVIKKLRYSWKQTYK